MESNLEQLQYFSLPFLYSIQSELVSTYGVVFLLILISLYLLLPDIKIKLSEYKNNKIFNSLGKLQLKNVSIQISVDETVYIDYVILVPTGILVLNVMNFNGFIFAGEKVEQWTQLLNKKSYKFPNPLHDLEICKSAVRGVVKDCDVTGHIVFKSTCEFPKGKPRKISLLHELLDELEFVKGNVDKQMDIKWNELINSDMFNINTRNNNFSMAVKGEQKSVKKALGLLILVSSLLLLIYLVANSYLT